MNTKRRTARIEEIAEKVAMGPFGSSIKVETFVTDGVPVVSGQHLHGFRVDDSPGFNFITAEHAERLANANVQRGDVVFTHAGNIGSVSYIPNNSQFERYVISQRQFYMRCDQTKVIPEFVTAYFKTPTGQHQLLANSSPVGVPSIAQPVSYLRTIEIPLPPLPEQRRIAEILGALDEKIELNRRTNETLEQMARALFKSWFVDFDPVRAKMNGRWRRGESLPSLPADLYDLFTDRLFPSELGEIPEGWVVLPLRDSYNLTMGQSPPGSTYNEDGDGLPFFQGNADFGFRYPYNRRYCTAPTRTADSDDTLVSVRAPVGAINMAWERCCIGRGLSALRHKSGSSSFTYYAIGALQGEIQQFEHTGTVFGAINRRQFEALLTLEPPAGVVTTFEKMVSDNDAQIKENVVESRILIALRDSLLPNLVGGELRVPAAEPRVEQA